MITSQAGRQRAVRLGVNVDHVATVRNARGGRHPDPVAAALLAIEAGADGITAHLREDRRHIRDDDMVRLKDQITRPLNFEMAATDEMVAIALRIAPHACCLVPERREERTTEGGLAVTGVDTPLGARIRALKSAGIRVSLFVEANPAVIAASAAIGADIVELHTGAWCDAFREGRENVRPVDLFVQLTDAAHYANSLGLEVHAGHGLDFETAGMIAMLPEIVELNIGHFLMGEALTTGLGVAVRTMIAAIAAGVAERPPP